MLFFDDQLGDENRFNWKEVLGSCECDVMLGTL